MAKTEMAPANKDRLKSIMSLIDSNIPKLQEIAGEHANANRIAQLVKLQIYNTPDLQKCDPVSLIEGILRFATLGLSPEKTAMEAYLIPRLIDNKYVCTFQLGYQGLRKMVLRTGSVAAMETRLVFANETFELWYDPAIKMKHVPILDPSTRGEIVGGYGYGRLKGGDPFISYMSIEEILSLKARGKGGQPAWRTDPEQMILKTICVRLCKQFPKSQQLEDAIAWEYRTNGPDFEREEQSTKELGTAGLKSKLAGPQKEDAVEPDRPRQLESAPQPSAEAGPSHDIDDIDDLDGLESPDF